MIQTPSRGIYTDNSPEWWRLLGIGLVSLTLIYLYALTVSIGTAKEDKSECKRRKMEDLRPKSPPYPPPKGTHHSY